jgi:hypothetical protein
MKAEVAKVNYSAMGTWLEPYISWEFKIKKVGKTVIWFYMDNGKPKPDVTKYYKRVFDLS